MLPIIPVAQTRAFSAFIVLRGPMAVLALQSTSICNVRQTLDLHSKPPQEPKASSERVAGTKAAIVRHQNPSFGARRRSANADPPFVMRWAQHR